MEYDPADVKDRRGVDQDEMEHTDYRVIKY